MQDPEADTEWNDALRKHGILPPKAPPPVEPEIVIDKAKEEYGKSMSDMTLDDLDGIEDDEDEQVLASYRAKRMAEVKVLRSGKFGEVLNITAKEYQAEINEAGTGVWVVLLLYAPDNVVCRRLIQIFQQLSAKYTSTKFVQSVAQNCIPNYPEKNCPSIFIYFENDLKNTIIGAQIFGGEHMSLTDVERVFQAYGALPGGLTTGGAATQKGFSITNVGKSKPNESDSDDD